MGVAATAARPRRAGFLQRGRIPGALEDSPQGDPEVALVHGTPPTEGEVLR